MAEVQTVKKQHRLRVEQKTHVKNGVGRMGFVALSILSQIIWFWVLAIKLTNYATWVSVLASLVALIFALRMFYRKTTSSIKMSWLIVILVFPVLGIITYLLLGRPDGTRRKRRSFEAISKRLEGLLPQEEETFKKLVEDDLFVANEMRYVKDFGRYPVYEESDTTYYKEAEEGRLAQLEAIKAAKHFIFMEYHAVEQESSFNELYEALKEKAKEGVEVRFLYDDVGSAWFINHDFVKRAKADGIDCRIFNPMVPTVFLFLNNRDHRKITVIDGRIAFTGGYNLAEEYFNRTHPYGYWKDTGVKICGKAAKSFTIMFLEMWNFVKHTDTEYEKYLNLSDWACDKRKDKETKAGYVQPYADNPLDFERVGENVYLNLIKGATKYITFVTPYLILSDEMVRELTLAAKRGVKVCMITPGIPDKKLTYRITRSYYGALVDEGVQIFEYTPGFCHAKMCVCDDKLATVGTINLDYRSLYHHFENGCLFYKGAVIKDIKQDFDEMISISTEVTDGYKTSERHFVSIGNCLLRLIAPLM